MTIIYHLDVFDDKVVRIQTLELSITLRVLQQLQQELARLERPSSLAGSVRLGLGVATNTSHEPPEGNNLLVGDHVLQILVGAVQGHLLDGLKEKISFKTKSSNSNIFF